MCKLSLANNTTFTLTSQTKIAIIRTLHTIDFHQKYDIILEDYFLTEDVF